MRDIRVGIIGTGPRGQGIIRNSFHVKGVKITALCDKFEALVKQAYDTVRDSQV